MRKLIVASPHRYPDLARLWHRYAMRELAPAFAGSGLEVETWIYCDGNQEAFDPIRYPGAILEAPSASARDFMEFYDSALARGADYLLIVDADAFFFDGRWAATYLEAFRDPSVAAVSLIPRNGTPAIYALLCRVSDYLPLPHPVFASSYDSPQSWPKACNLQPGDLAARRLIEQGRKILNVTQQASEEHVANFHGTTVIRISRELFGGLIGDVQFTSLVAQERYYAVGAWDNILLGELYRAHFHEPFAAGPDGLHLTGSMTVEQFGAALEQVLDPVRQRTLAELFRGAAGAVQKLASTAAIELALPNLIPSAWATP